MVLLLFCLSALFALLGAGFDDDAEADQEEHKHGEVENVGFLGSAFEFFPDQDAPKSGDQGRALAKAVGDGWSGFAGGHEVNAVAQAPDQAAKDADQVDREAALEVFFLGYRLAGDREAHGDGVEDEVGGEDAQREDEEGRIRRHLAGFRSGDFEVHVHGPCDEAVEEGHQDTADDGKDDALADAFGAAGAFRGVRFQFVGESVAENGDDDQSYAAKKQDGVALRLDNVVDDNAQDEGQADAYGESHAHVGNGERGG